MLRFLLVSLLVTLPACGQPPPPDASGAEIYQQVCSNCHGDDLEGGIGPALGPGTNAASQDDDFLVLTITRGRGRMPSFAASLSEDQIARVVEHLRARQAGEESR